VGEVLTDSKSKWICMYPIMTNFIHHFVALHIRNPRERYRIPQFSIHPSSPFQTLKRKRKTENLKKAIIIEKEAFLGPKHVFTFNLIENLLLNYSFIKNLFIQL
jgi:hypothetical protein